jgi:hypothetical protein
MPVGKGRLAENQFYFVFRAPSERNIKNIAPAGAKIMLFILFSANPDSYREPSGLYRNQF